MLSAQSENVEREKGLHYLMVLTAHAHMHARTHACTHTHTHTHKHERKSIGSIFARELLQHFAHKGIL